MKRSQSKACEEEPKGCSKRDKKGAMARRRDIPSIVIEGKRQSWAEACVCEAVVVQGVYIKKKKRFSSYREAVI